MGDCKESAVEDASAQVEARRQGGNWSGDSELSEDVFALAFQMMFCRNLALAVMASCGLAGALCLFYTPLFASVWLLPFLVLDLRC